MNHHLIIQGHDVSTPDLKRLHAIAEAGGIERIGDMAFRLPNANIRKRDEVATHCEVAQLDFAFVPPGRKWSDLRLIAMDMDSTLITIECLDEIADFVGKKAEVAAITEAAMRGEIADWKESFRRRVALLAGLDVSAMERVYNERLTLTPGAEALISKAKAAGIKLLLVSGGFTFFTDRLKARLSLDYAYSNTVEIVDGKFTGQVLGDLVDGAEKARLVRDTMARLSITPGQTVAIGDGANDLPMMREVGTGIAFHAKPVVRAQATLALSHAGLDGVLNLFES
ncbi:MAG: phosphoserine phosphatase SerB [Betaproteobacteria bacterium]|nr:phosphoserine phosphatase SerB [Betaproteobacteria bacterium]